MDDDITVVKNVKVRFLSIKSDKYGNEISWFRIDKNSIGKLSVINKIGFKHYKMENVQGYYVNKLS